MRQGDKAEHPADPTRDNLNLATLPESWCDESSKADVLVLRQNVKNTLYAFVNSNVMNGEVIGYRMPLWTIALIAFDCLMAAVVVVWGIVVYRKRKNSQNGRVIVIQSKSNFAPLFKWCVLPCFDIL